MNVLTVVWELQSRLGHRVGSFLDVHDRRLTGLGSSWPLVSRFWSYFREFSTVFDHFEPFLINSDRHLKVFYRVNDFNFKVYLIKFWLFVVVLFFLYSIDFDCFRSFLVVLAIVLLFIIIYRSFWCFCICLQPLFDESWQFLNISSPSLIRFWSFWIYFFYRFCVFWPSLVLPYTNRFGSFFNVYGRRLMDLGGFDHLQAAFDGLGLLLFLSVVTKIWQFLDVLIIDYSQILIIVNQSFLITFRVFFFNLYSRMF